MISDLRYALRQLAKSPGSSVLAVIALALGIGANSAMFSIVNTLFLRPLPYPNAERLVQLTSSLPERQLNNVPFSWPRFLAVRDQQQVFSDQLPGLAFRPSCYLAPSGEVYVADSVAVTYTKAGPLVQVTWIAASPLFARWATTP